MEGPKPSGGTRCPLCGRSWYCSSAPALGATIVQDGKALVTVRPYEPEKGRVSVHGDFLNVGVHPVDGIAREAREELGLEPEVVEVPILLALHTYGPDGAYVLAIEYRTRIVEGEPYPTDDVAETRWSWMEVIDGTDFAWKHDRGFVQAALEDA